ncbi:MAG: type I secretion system permease/ATPase [Alphaproteobacteria bacterium]|nr:type I secretion system permease/ATPase [Alphaproteobacteria bacterium SS10]
MSDANNQSGENRAEVSLLNELTHRSMPGLVISFFASFFVALCMLGLPLYMFQTFDRVIGSGNQNTLWALTALTIGFMIVYGLVDFGRRKIHLILSNWAYERLNLDSLQAMVSANLKGGSSANQIVTDIGQIRRFIAGQHLVALFEAVWSILFIAVAFWMHPIFGLVLLSGIIGLIILAVVNQMMSSRAVADSRDASTRSNLQLNMALRNAELIQGLGILNVIGERWRRTEAHNMKVGEKGVNRANIIMAMSRSFRLIIQVAAICAAAFLILAGEVSPAVFIAILLIMSRALAPYEQLIDGWSQWVAAGRAYNRLSDVLGEKQLHQPTMSYPRPSGLIEVERLVYIPPGRDSAVLRGISFAVQPGQALGILGPSAAGKSTLLRLIMGILKPNVGAVRFDGQDVTQWARDDLGPYLGYVPQETALFDGTIRENIARMTDADPLKVIEAAKRADVHEIIGRLPAGYDTPINSASAVLTGGQKQRIALARALFGRPSILLLDEPDANLDREGEAALQRTIRKVKQEGTTVVCVSHRRSVLDQMDALLLLEEGSIRRFGARSEVLPLIEQRGAKGPTAQPMRALPGGGAQGNQPGGGTKAAGA